jgi:exonuclease III
MQLGLQVISSWLGKIHILIWLILQVFLTAKFHFVSDYSVFFTGIYGPSTQLNRPQFFHQLQYLKQFTSDPWILAGDFNITANSSDHNNKVIIGEIS